VLLGHRAAVFDGVDTDVIQNTITLPNGEVVSGNVLHRGDSADRIYDADGDRIFTETGDPTSRQQLHDASIERLADLAGRDLSTPEARAQAQRDFADAAYMMFQGPVVNRGSDSTIRAFLTTAYTQAFGQPPILPHDIDVQAYARTQQDFIDWLSDPQRGALPPRGSAPDGGGDGANLTPTPEVGTAETGASSAVPQSTYRGDSAGRANGHNVPLAWSRRYRAWPTTSVRAGSARPPTPPSSSTSAGSSIRSGPWLASAVVTMDGDLASRYDGTCAGCGVARRFEFRIPDVIVPPPAHGVCFGGEACSELLDPGEWMIVADAHARRVPAHGRGSIGDSESGERLLAIAIAAIDEIAKFVPPGADEPPAEAFTSERGQAVRAAEPGRFRRARLAAVRATYAANAGR